MTDNFSGLVGKKFITKANLTGSIVGVYLRHKGWFWLLLGSMETELVFILWYDEDQRIYEIAGNDLFGKIRVVDN